MLEDFNLDDARKYADEIDKNKEIDPFKVARTLKLLAETGDETRFKALIDYHVAHPDCDGVD